MNRKTYEALVASVEKWRRNAVLRPEDGKTGPLNCPLCLMFWTQDHTVKDCCVGCPVFDATGIRHCGDTPYPDAEYAQTDATAEEWQAAAQREADFLAALVPAGGPDE